MKVLILGCGNIGSIAAEDISKSMDSIEVVVADSARAMLSPGLWKASLMSIREKRE